MKRLLVFLLVFIPLLIGTQVYIDRKVFPHDWIGTYYEVPVANGYRLVATSVDYGTIIDTDGVTVVDHIDSIQVTDNAVIGVTASQYFLFQPVTGALSVPRLPHNCPNLRLLHPLQESLQLSCSFIRDLTKSKGKMLGQVSDQAVLRV